MLRETLAKRICLTCPVLPECTAHALATDERYGVWGGLTPAERDRLRRRRARPTRTRTAVDRRGSPGSGIKPA